MTLPLRKNLHPALVYLILAVFAWTCFMLLAFMIRSRSTLTRFDHDQAQRMKMLGEKHPDLRAAALWITEFGSGRPRAILAAGVAIVLLAGGQWRLALLWVLMQCLTHEIISWSKEYFHRPRPVHFDPQLASGWSFPSGHALGSMTGYGMCAFLIHYRWPGHWLAWTGSVLCVGMIVVVGLSRMVIGVHWFTDIIGGYLLGIVWNSIFIALIEWHKIRSAVSALTNLNTH